MFLNTRLNHLLSLVKTFYSHFQNNRVDSSAIYFSIQQKARANGFELSEFTEIILNKTVVNCMPKRYPS